MDAGLLVPVICGDVRRLEIVLSDAELVAMDMDTQRAYEAFVQSALGHGLEVLSREDPLTHCIYIVIRPQKAE